MPLKAIGGEITSQGLNDNFSYLESILMGLVVNITDFEAKLDGVTDDSQAFKDALAYTTIYGGKVFIPYSSNGCLIGSTIDLPDNTWIVGVKTRFLSKLTPTVGGGSCPTKIFNKVNGKNITFESIILDGQYDKSTWEQGVGVQQNNLLYMEKVDGIRFLDFELTNFRNNKDTSTTPDTFYPAFIKNCSNLYADNFRQTNLINNEGIRFINCTKIHFKDFYSNNEQCWTPLHLYYCDDVLLENPHIENTNTNWDLASSINMYSSNVTIRGGKILGGRGIDPSDEYEQGNGFVSENVTFEGVYIETLQGFYTSVASLIKNFKILRCHIKSTNDGVTWYLTQLDGFRMRDCKLETTNTGVVRGLKVDTRSGGYLKNAIIEGNKFDGYDTGIYLYLRQGAGLDGIQINKNKIYASALGAKDSYGGSSGGIFVYLYDADVQAGAYFKNITFSNNEIDAEGSYILFITSNDSNALSVIDSKKVNILNNNGYSTRNAVKRGFQLRTLKKLLVNGNTIADIDSAAQNVLSYCQDIRINGNESGMKTGLTGQPGWRIDNCSGYLNTVGNTGTGTITGNFLYTSATNSFTSKSNIGNLPSTIDAGI